MNDQHDQAGSAIRVLVTGASGYIGGRLVPRLIAAGHAVRVLVRDRSRVAGRGWAERVEIAVGDLLDAESLREAVRDVDAIVYLVHSMAAGRDFGARDREAAENLLAVRPPGAHIVYLGGLMPQGGSASGHLTSRAEVGEILRRDGNATEFRAGPIIGSGSASFEMVRYLTERLPVMIAPKWIRNDVQPIAVRDVLAYLKLAVERRPGGVIDIGAEPLSFKRMMTEYAAVRGLRRWILPVPVLAPGLAARWVGLVTPIPNRLAVPLVRGVVKPLVGDTTRAAELFPEIEPIGYRRSVELAVARISQGAIETRWSGALGIDADAGSVHREDWEGRIREVRTVDCAAPVEALYRSFAELGGDRGWLVYNWAWRLRGLLDTLIGGPGLRRGRRDPHDLLPGESLDFWRVEVVEPPHRLLLRAEMKVPGHARLSFEADALPPADDGSPRSRLRQTAHFDPRGFPGALYWYLLYPAHAVIFSAMARAVARDAERRPDRSPKS
jgi:uncharacterized protein YbjT (DUF2867 family)